MTLGLTLYDLAMLLARPAVPSLLKRRLAKGKEDGQRLNERMGRPKLPRPQGPLIWVHGASVGECNAVLPLIERILAEYPQHNVMLTSGTVTSAALMAKRLPARAFHQFVPFDENAAVKRFIKHWRPQVAVFVESEIWPNKLRQLRKSGAAIVLVNARMSERSANRWSYTPNTIRHLLSQFDTCLAQSEADAQRLVQLGAPHVSITGNLKFDVGAPPANEADVTQLRSAIGPRPIWLAASTHPGEEVLIAETHRRLKSKIPDILTLIVPRHASRGEEILETVSQAGEIACLRSTGALPEKQHGIYIADTMGELGLFYRLSRVSFIGGSLVAHGGQNPIEAAKLGSVLIHGPHITNFAFVYSAFDRKQASTTVDGPAELAQTVQRFLSSPERMRASAATALETVESLSGALDKTALAMRPYLLASTNESR